MQQGAGIDINKLKGIVAALARNNVPPCSAQAVLSHIRYTVLHRSNRPRRGGCSGGKPQEPSRIHSWSYQQQYSGFYRLAILQQSHNQQRDSLSLRWREQGLQEPRAEEMHLSLRHGHVHNVVEHGPIVTIDIEHRMVSDTASDGRSGSRMRRSMKRSRSTPQGIWR